MKNPNLFLIFGLISLINRIHSLALCVLCMSRSTMSPCACLPAGLAVDLVRLIGGDSSSSGRLEVFHENVWGEVCGVGWTLQNSQVVCKELGYARALPTSGLDSNYGSGRVSIAATNNTVQSIDDVL